MHKHRNKVHRTLLLLACILAGMGLWPLVGMAQDAPGSAAPMDDWARIQRTGRLFAGTAADNPPFSYFDDNFAMTGFEPALMAALAEKLGVQPEMQEIVFPTLLDAVSLGQVDAAIASLAVTDGRSQEVDFSIPYYVDTEGVLAVETGPDVTVKAVEDLAGYKIGVQTGSIYVTWLRENLVNTGLLPAEDIVLFDNVDQAVDALSKGAVDLAVTDNLGARDYVRKGGFKLVGQGLTKQFYAIALRKGSTLLAPLNDALVALQQEGVITQLAADHLALDKAAVWPLPTPAPTPAPTPEPCKYLSKFGGDLNYDDNNGPPVVQPGQAIAKQWRLYNVGTCPWDSNFKVAFLGGAQLGAQPYALGQSVAPGGAVVVTLNMTAPMPPGVYQSKWILADDKGALFGQPFWATFTVPGAAPSPPAPTAVPPGPLPPPPPPPPAPPSIDDFHASHHKVAVGLCVKLRWQVSGNVTEVKIKRDGSDWKTNLGTSGSKKDCPDGDGKHSYELKVRGPGGEQSAWEEVKFKYIPLAGDAGEPPGGD